MIIPFSLLGHFFYSHLQMYQSMYLLSNSRCQNRKERQNWFTNNGDLVDKAKHDVVSEGVSVYNYREAELQ